MGLLEIAMATHPKILGLFDSENGNLNQPLNFTLLTNGTNGNSIERLSSSLTRLLHSFSLREFDFEKALHGMEKLSMSL